MTRHLLVVRQFHLSVYDIQHFYLKALRLQIVSDFPAFLKDINLNPNQQINVQMLNRCFLLGFFFWGVGGADETWLPRIDQRI